ncbi:MAG: phage major capsid protein [Firmicutes bacterium]|nr:phage major capsid protein [Bacillota bacterium]
MTLQELKQKCAALCDKQEALVNKALEEEREMTEEENKEFENLQKEIDGLNDLIVKAEKMQNRATDLDQPDGKKYRTIPGAPSENNKKLDDGGFKSLGEFVCAVRFGDPKGRLQYLKQGQGEGGGLEVPDAFKAQITPKFRNEWSMGVGEEGGFAVPAQFRPDMLMIQPEPSIVRQRSTVLPAGEPPDAGITVPAFKQGADGVFGGVEVYWIGEGQLKPETDGKLEEVSLTPKEVAAHTVVTDKLLRNWEAASAFISTLLRGAMISAEDMAFLRGNGVAKPMGVFNAPGAVQVVRANANQIGYIDTVNMLASLLPESQSRAVYIANQSTMPQLATMQDPAGHYIFIQGDATRGIPATLNGLPIIFTGKTPTLGNQGDLMLVDLTYYLIKDGSGPFIAASEHVLFRQNKTIVKIFWNVDGQGWVKEPLLLEDGQTQVSPYVVLV